MTTAAVDQRCSFCNGELARPDRPATSAGRRLYAQPPDYVCGQCQYPYWWRGLPPRLVSLTPLEAVLEASSPIDRGLEDEGFVQYQRDDRLRRITVTIEGPVTYALLCAVIKRQAAEGTWSYAIVYDKRWATSAPTAEEHLRLYAEVQAQCAVHGPRGAVAIVLSSDDLFEQGERYSAGAGPAGFQAQTFRTLESAEAWLSA
jgi:hypothetical protein